jgi:hypothetical protein
MLAEVKAGARVTGKAAAQIVGAIRKGEDAETAETAAAAEASGFSAALLCGLCCLCGSARAGQPTVNGTLAFVAPHSMLSAPPDAVSSTEIVSFSAGDAVFPIVIGTRPRSSPFG